MTGATPTERRIGTAQVLERDLHAVGGSWLSWASGLAPVILVLAAVTYGVSPGRPGVAVVGGSTVSYGAWVAPALVVIQALLAALWPVTRPRPGGSASPDRGREALAVSPLMPSDLARADLVAATLRAAGGAVVVLAAAAALGVLELSRVPAALAASLLVALAAGGAAGAATWARGEHARATVRLGALALVLVSPTLLAADSMPGPLGAVTAASPLTWGIDVLRAAVLGSPAGSGVVAAVGLLGVGLVGALAALARPAGSGR